jgi:hypothetical protein
MGERPPGRRRRWFLIIVVLLLAALGAGEWLASRALRAKIMALAEKKLDAELQLGPVFYIPPYGAWVYDAHLIRNKREIFQVDSIDLSLAEFPLGHGPIIIASLGMDGPTANLSPGAFTNLIKKDAREHEPRKLSNMLRLEQVRIIGGRVWYRDPRHPELPPTVWSRMDLSIDTTRKSASQYSFHVMSKATYLADASAAGSIDVDSLDLEIQNLTMKMRAEPEPPRTPFPTVMQEFIRDHRVAGSVAVSGSGRFPLRQPGQSIFSGLITLQDATLALPGDSMLEHARATLRCSMTPGGPVVVAMEKIDLAAVGKQLNIDTARAEVDLAAGTWKLMDVKGNVLMQRVATTEPSERKIPLDKFEPAGRVDFVATASGPMHLNGADPWTGIDYEVIGKPDRFSYRPKDFADRIEDITGGEVRLAKGMIFFQELSGKYGTDELKLRSARLPVKGLPKVAAWQEISGSVTFTPPRRRYSPKLDKVLDALSPQGPFLIAGSFTTDKRTPTTQRSYDLIVSSDTGAFTVSPRRITLGRIRGDATVTPAGVEVHGAEADVLGGQLQAGGHWVRGDVTTSDVTTYDGDMILRDLDLEALEQRLTDERPDKPLKGRVRGRMSFSGALPREAPAQEKLKTIRAEGEVEVVDGSLFHIPVLNAIAKNIGLKQAATAGEAAVVFDIEQGQVRLRDAAVNSPVLGLQGGGAIGLDGSLNLNVVAAPLADWRDKLRETRIPLVSNVVGDIAGRIQKMLNKATGALLYQFRIEGSVKDVKVVAVPTPVLSDAAAFVFEKMLTAPKKQQRPLDLLEKEPASRARAQ